jgi:AraC-like DNA-binding protein
MLAPTFAVMLTTIEAKGKQPGIAEKFAGAGCRVLNVVPVQVSNAVMVECMEVQQPDDELPDDRGMLYLYPIGESRFCLHLCYLEYLDTSDDRAVIYSIRFMPELFTQFPADVLMANQPFRFDETTEQQFSVCSQARTLLAQLTQEAGGMSAFIRSLQRTETAMHLLRRALECITVPFTTCQVPACRFLAYEGERDKISLAIDILRDNIDQPHSIRELSRKVAMNECYLKKGFKAITGKTIHEYQQQLRIDKARTLLQQQGMSVTDVANTLGYSSISHFSTAFKKVTGMKPCELLA